MSRRLPQLLLAAGSLIILGVMIWQRQSELTTARGRIAQLERELSSRGVALPAPVADPESPAPVATPTTKPANTPQQHVDVGRYLRMIDDLRVRTSELERELQDAKADAERTRTLASGQSEEVKKLNTRLDDMKEDLTKQQRVSEALDAELKFKSQRLTQIETSSKLLEEKLARAEQASKKLTGSTKEVEDLNRRREATLVNLERRYREVTDLYRSFSLNLQTREAPGQGLQAGDLSRIQGALQQAEEELRQLRSLTARITELERPTRKP